MRTMQCITTLHCNSSLGPLALTAHQHYYLLSQLLGSNKDFRHVAEQEKHKINLIGRLLDMVRQEIGLMDVQQICVLVPCRFEAQCQTNIVVYKLIHTLLISLHPIQGSDKLSANTNFPQSL